MYSVFYEFDHKYFGAFEDEKQAENFALLINGYYICPNGDEIHYI